MTVKLQDATWLPPLDTRTLPELLTSSFSSITSAALAGAGIAMLPTYFVADELARGALVRLLPDHEPEVLGLHAVVLSRQHQPRPLKLLIDFLAERFGGDLAPWDRKPSAPPHRKTLIDTKRRP